MTNKKNFKHVYTPGSQAEITIKQTGKKQLLVNDAADQEKTERKRGSNRRIYDEPTKSTSFKLPLSAIEKLKELSALAGTNTTQYLLKLLNDDYTAKTDELEAISRIRKRMKE